MDLQRFFALRTGPVALPDGEPAELVIHDLGTLRVASGQLAIADTTALEDPVIVPIPEGKYSVKLTVAKVREGYDLAGKREAYMSLVLSEVETVSVAPAAVDPTTRAWRDEPTGGIAGIAGLSGVKVGEIPCVAMVDAETIATGMPGSPDTWYSAFIAPDSDPGWFGRMDTEEDGPKGALNTVLPTATDGENIAMVITRTEQLYPLLASYDAAGALTGIHVDLLVLGELTEILDAYDGQSESAAWVLEQEAARARPVEPPERKRKFFGLFG